MVSTRKRVGSQESETSLKFGVVVVHFNTPDVLGRCLESIQSGRHKLQVVVVDNASTEPNREAARMAAAERSAAFHEADNGGFAAGANIGIRRLTGVDVVVLVNPDAQLAPGALDCLIGYLADNPSVAACSPLILNDQGRVWYAGGHVNRWEGRVKLPGFGSQPADIKTGPTGFVTGCVVALRKAALDEVGPLNEEFFLYFEDVELSERLLAAGWGLGAVAEAVAVHDRGGHGDPDRNLSPVMLRHSMTSRLRWIRGSLSGARRVSALAFTPLWAVRLAYLVVRAGHSRTAADSCGRSGPVGCAGECGQSTDEAGVDFGGRQDGACSSVASVKMAAQYRVQPEPQS